MSRQAGKPKDGRVETLRKKYLKLYHRAGAIGDIARLRIELIELVGEKEQGRLIGIWNKEAEGR